MHYTHQKYQIFFFFVLFLTFFLNVNSYPEITTTSGVVNFSDSWLSSEPQNGVTYTGTRNVIPPAPGSTATKKLIYDESWDPPNPKEGKEGPDEIITYTLTSRVTGQGVILMSISGQTTKSYDVGSFRPQNVQPTSLTVETNLEAYRIEKYTNLRSYVGSYVPSIYDTCYPVENKGYDTEIKAGTENLSASGIVTSKQITVSYGTETALQKYFTVGASWPPGGDASFGGGKSETLKWGWTLDDHSGNTSTPASLNGSFTVVLNDTDFHNNSPSGENVQPPAPCATCPNCQRSVHTETDHVKRTCPLDGTPKGCGEPIYDCTDEEEKLQDAWHMVRTCTNPASITYFPLCGDKFRHCKNGNCTTRVRFWKGHSDGSISQATAGVTNGYPESHVLEDPPDDDTELASDTSPDCASCTSTSECSTCSSDGDASASTDCASCTSTSECSACDTTETSTSATPTEPGLYPPSDDDSTITIYDELMVDSYPGQEDISVILVMPSGKGYSQIYLYLADANDTGYGNQLGDTLRPSSSSLVTEVSLEIDIPNDVSGVCTITAYIHPHPSASDQTCYEYSFKIYIS